MVLIGFIFVRVDVVVLVDVVVIVVHFFLLGQPTETVAAAAAPSSRCSGYSRRPLSRSGERVTRTRAGWIDKIYIYPGEDLKEKKKWKIKPSYWLLSFFFHFDRKLTCESRFNYLQEDRVWSPRVGSRRRRRRQGYKEIVEWTWRNLRDRFE